MLEGEVELLLILDTEAHSDMVRVLAVDIYVNIDN